MTPTNFFTTGYVFTGTWDDYFILLVILICMALGVLLFLERPKHDPAVHSPRMAWLRAGLYFGFVTIVSWTTSYRWSRTCGARVGRGRLHQPARLANISHLGCFFTCPAVGQGGGLCGASGGVCRRLCC